jgi:hypothetical protein
MNPLSPKQAVFQFGLFAVGVLKFQMWFGVDVLKFQIKL